jgi:hypothetical protein
MRRGLAIVALSTSLACGAPVEAPAEAPVAVAETPAAAPIVLPPHLPTLPFVLAAHAPRPAPSSAEDALVVRWAQILGVDPAREDLDLRVDRTDIALAGEGTVLSFQGRDPTSPPPVEALLGGSVSRVEHVWVEDQRAGRRVVVRLAAQDPLDLEPSDALTPWLAGVFACDDASVAERPSIEALRSRCTEMTSQLGAQLLARFTRGTEREETQRLLTELFRLGAPSDSVEIESEGPLRGAHAPGARFVPFEVTVGDRPETTTVTGTARTSRTCGVTIEHQRFVLTMSPGTLTLERAPLSRETMTTHCL